MPKNPRFEKLVSEAKASIHEISATEAEEQRSNGAILIDVRESDEFAKGHARHAVHLSKGVVELKIEQQVPDPSTPIICYCGGGSRSALAAASLQNMGYSNVSSMIGGFKAWQEAALPTES